MKTNYFLLATLLFISTWACQPKHQTVICNIETSLGNIQVELYTQQAPITVANFLTYVDSNWYNGSDFFRVCTPENEADREFPIQVIQGGDLPETKRLPPIPMETTEQTGIKHLNGTISMARDTPNSAQSDFFICIGDQPELDYNGRRNPDGQGFAAFGKVIKGMDVVKKIQAQKDSVQMLFKPVEIVSIQRFQ